jgi:hypothetical protein
MPLILILTSLQALLNTLVSLETAFSAKKRSVQTRSLSLFATALVIMLTLALVLSITYVSNLLTFTSSFGVFVVYTCLVLCLDLIDFTLTVKTFACVCTGTLLKSSFVKAREHVSKSCSLIVTSCFITLSKTAFVFVASFIMSRYCFLRVFCLLWTSSVTGRNCSCQTTKAHLRSVRFTGPTDGLRLSVS